MNTFIRQSLLLGLVIVVVLALVGVVAYVSKFIGSPHAVVKSFGDCAKYYPVMESYPAQCRTPDGRLFVQELTDEEEDRIKPPPSCRDQCGNGACEEIVCLSTDCPCSETAETCPADCASGKIKSGSSGARGAVMLGPQCPVMREGDERCNDKPYPTTVEIFRGGNTATLHATAQTDGRAFFTVKLEPGIYILRPRGGEVFPACGEQEVRVDSKQYTEVSLSCDTGIR